MIEVGTFRFNSFVVNSFVVYDSEEGSAMIIDPGCFESYEQEELEEFISSRNLNVKYVVNTHCHIDHILGNKFCVDKYGSQFIIPSGDEFLLDMASKQGEMFGIKCESQPVPDKKFSGGEELNLGKTVVNFIFTPGHSPGELSIFFKNEKLLFSGDVLFREGIGRTDLWEGDYHTLLDSINDKLFSLPDETVVFPGHGAETTIGYEKSNNPFL